MSCILYSLIAMILSGGQFSDAPERELSLSFFRPWYFELAYDDVPRTVSPGATSNVTVDDCVIRRDVGPVVKSDKHVYPVVLRNELQEPIQWSSSNESRATVNEDGFVSHLTDGLVTITATSGDLTKFLDFTLTTSGSSSDTFIEFATGTLGKYIVSSIDDRIIGRTASNSTKSIFSTQNHTGGIYARNPNCWAANLDLTGCSPWNSSGQIHNAGTLVSPRHLFFATHYCAPKNASIRFVKANGEVVTRTISDLRHLQHDVTIGVLDSDVPAGIAWYSVLPFSISEYCTRSNELLALFLDQEEKALVGQISRLENGAYFGDVIVREPSSTARANWYERPIAGDSGNPIFVVINDDPVLVSHWTYSESGPNYARQLSAINTAMNQLGGGYQLDVYDLSGFPSF